MMMKTMMKTMMIDEGIKTNKKSSHIFRVCRALL